MASSIPAPEKALRDLQRVIRRPPSMDTGVVVMRKRLLPDLQTDPPQEIRLEADQVKMAKTAIAALLADLRFEHLDHADDDVWHFVAECALDGRDHVPAFIEDHQKEPIDAICYIPVESLTVKAETDALGIRLLPVGDPRIPQSMPRQAFNLEKPVGSVAAVDVRGTDYGRMAERAKEAASHALRVLRVALGAQHGYHVRFRLGTGYAFDDKLTG